MAAFSSSFQQQHPFLFDSVVNSPSSINNNNNNNNNMYALLEEPNNPNSNTCFSQFYQPLERLIHNLDHSTNITALSNNINEASVFSVTNKNSMDSSSIVTDHKYHEHHHMSSDQIIQKELNPTNKKRKSKQASLANSAQSKDMREVKGKKEKKKKDGELEKKNKCKEIEMKATEEGYIHVRARRGQATDSHSLAERVRRERISERMKLLQALVPGCDKVTGKALMLDEIINYVQSLQNQVEFLSMKLASVNPMFYDFGMDLEPFMVRPDQNLSNLSSPLPAMQQFSSTTASNYPLMDNSANSLLFQQAQLPNTLLAQGDRQVLWEVDDQIRQRIVNQSGFSNNLFSFH